MDNILVEMLGIKYRFPIYFTYSFPQYIVRCVTHLRQRVVWKSLLLQKILSLVIDPDFGSREKVSIDC
jgi:hypothetical protein